MVAKTVAQVAGAADAVAMTTALARHTPKGNATPLAYLDFVAERLAASGVGAARFDWSDAPGSALFATLGPDVAAGGYLLGFNAAFDAPTADAFSVPRTSDRRLTGRGVGQIHGYLGATLALLPELCALDLKRPLHLLVGVTSRVAGHGFAGVLGELRQAGLAPAAALIAAPTDGAVITAHRGLYTCRTHVVGADAPADAPENGLNAIHIAAQLVATLEGLALDIAEDEEADDSDRGPDKVASGPGEPLSELNVMAISGGASLLRLPAACTFDWHYRPRGSAAWTELIEGLDAEATALQPEMRAVDPGAGITTSELRALPPLMAAEDDTAARLAIDATGRGEALTGARATIAGMYQRCGFSTAVWGPGAAAWEGEEQLATEDIGEFGRFVRRVSALAARD